MGKRTGSRSGRTSTAPLRVLITRPKGQTGELAARLRKAGARVLAIPTIRIMPPADPVPMDRAIVRLREGGYDRVVFTSVNGVERLLRRLRSKTPLEDVRLSAIGPKTAESLQRLCIRDRRKASTFMITTNQVF